MENINCSAGPWELDSAKDGDTRYQIIHGQVPKGINADFGYPVADTMNRHHCISPEEDRANGHLLAAAFDLYTQLKALIVQIEHSPNLIVPPGVLAAIAKAEGR